MHMDAGLDTGAILLQEHVAIEDDDNAQSLHDKLARLGASCIVRVLHERPSPGTLKRAGQRELYRVEPTGVEPVTSRMPF